MKKGWIILVLVVVVLALTACAAGPNDMRATENPDGHVAGFWLGIWHGFIAPFAFIVSLFNHNVGIYEIHNNGGWYNFGYLFGLTMILGGSGGGAGRRSKG
jgi:hypothetical protein